MVLCCGEALIDFLNVPGEKECFSAAPGGSPFNTAVACARLDVPTALFTCLSGDLFGERLFDHLRKNGGETACVLRSEAPSTLAFADRSSSETRYAFFVKGTADRMIQPRDIPQQLPEDVEASAVGSLATVLRPIADSLLLLVRREHGRRLVSFDPNVRESLINDREEYLARFFELVRFSHLVKASDKDLQWLFPTSSIEEAASSLLARGAELVVVTQGSAGSLAFTTNETSSVPSPPTRVSDTIGAGDSFHGAVLAWLHREGLLSPGKPGELTESRLGEMLRFAGAAAAITCTRPGADPPRRDELE